MENQHRKISGYRELTEGDIDLMNTVKALGPQIEAVISTLTTLHRQQRHEVELMRAVSDEGAATRIKLASYGIKIEPGERAMSADGKVGLNVPERMLLKTMADAESARLEAAQPERWLAMGRSELQDGLMKLTRSIAQPTFF